MEDPTIKRLLERTIDSPLKLQLILLFAEHPHLEGTATRIAERIYRDIWSTREALGELHEAGVLSAVSHGGEIVYRFRPRPDLIEPISRLCRMYNEPLERDSIYRLVRNASINAFHRYSRTLAREFVL